MLYQLMNKDEVVATYKEQQRLDDYRYVEVSRHCTRAHDPLQPPEARGTERLRARRPRPWLPDNAFLIADHANSLKAADRAFRVNARIVRYAERKLVSL